MPKLKQFAAILGLVCTVAIAASTAPASAGQFDGVTVRIGTFGGKWRDIVDSYVAKAFEQFDEAGRMKPSPYYDRIVDVMEELMKFTLMTRDVSATLTDRYSERKESAEKLAARVDLKAL